MSRRPNTLIPANFPAVPALADLEAIAVCAGAPSGEAEAIGWTVCVEGGVPAELGLDRAALIRADFNASVGSVLILPSASGPERIAVGAGNSDELTPATLRDIAAAFTRAAARRTNVGLSVTDRGPVNARSAAQALSEGAVLARYRYTPLRADAKHVPLTALSIDLAGADAAAIEEGAAVGLIAARATVVARDLANTPPSHLTATDMGEIALGLWRSRG